MWLRQSVLQFILMSPNNNISSRLWMFCQSFNGFIGCLHLFLAIFNLSLLNICCYHTAVMWHSSVNVNDCSFTRRQDQSGHDGKWSLVLFLYRWMSHTEFSTFFIWSLIRLLKTVSCSVSFLIMWMSCFTEVNFFSLNAPRPLSDLKGQLSPWSYQTAEVSKWAKLCFIAVSNKKLTSVASLCCLSEIFTHYLSILNSPKKHIQYLITVSLSLICDQGRLMCSERSFLLW